MRVLIVDDAKVIRKTLRMFLQNQGIRDEDIFEAEGGVQGLEMHAELDPDLMLLDIEMPDITGDKVLDEVLGRDSDLKIVIMSAHPRDDPRIIHAISQGAFEAVQKPIRQDDVGRLVNMVRKEQRGGGSII